MVEIYSLSRFVTLSSTCGKAVNRRSNDISFSHERKEYVYSRNERMERFSAEE